MLRLMLGGRLPLPRLLLRRGVVHCASPSRPQRPPHQAVASSPGPCARVARCASSSGGGGGDDDDDVSGKVSVRTFAVGHGAMGGGDEKKTELPPKEVQQVPPQLDARPSMPAAATPPPTNTDSVSVSTGSTDFTDSSGIAPAAGLGVVADVVEAVRLADSEMRMQLSVIAGLKMCLNFGLGVIVPVLPVVCAGAGLGPSGVGMLLSATALGQVMVNFQMGYVADTVGRRAPMLAGTTLGALSDLATAVAHTTPMLLGSRMSLGMADSAVTASTGAYLADVTGKVPQHRGLIIGGVMSLGMLAYAAGPAVGGALTSAAGAHLPFLFSGGLWLCCTAATYRLPETLHNPVPLHEFVRTLFRRVPPPVAAAAGGELRGQQAAGEEGGGTPANKLPFLQGLAALLRRPQLQSIFALDAFGGVSWALYIAIVPLHTLRHFNVDIAELGLAMSAAAAFSIAGSALGGWASDRFGRLRVIRNGTIVSTASVAGMVLAERVELFALALIVWELSEGLKYSALHAHVADIVPVEERGRTFAMRQQFESTVMLLAPLSLGMLAEATTTSHAFAMSTAVMGACGGFFIFNARREQQQEEEQRRRQREGRRRP